MKLLIVLIFISCSLHGQNLSLTASKARYPAKYNLIWDSPSNGAAGSMPLGNGDIGLNVWADQEGNVNFYLAKTDAWSENGRLLKIGKLRFNFSPNPFKRNNFQQTLHLDQGTITIMGGVEKSPIIIRIWVDAHRPVVHIESESQQPLSLEVFLEVWRNQVRPFQGGTKGMEINSAYGLKGSPQEVYIYPDSVIFKKNSLLWAHRNRNQVFREGSLWEMTLKRQGLASLLDTEKDPLRNRTFGALVEGDGMISQDSLTLRSAKPKQKQHVTVSLHTNQTKSLGQWIREIQSLSQEAGKVNLSDAFQSHAQWWADYWNRSRLEVSGTPQADTVMQGYLLQKFISACATRGAFPPKFNGSLFTFEMEENLSGQSFYFNADYRRWGGEYWFQNTRLMYWPMLATGDFDMMLPFFDMYLQALPLAKERVRRYFGHQGAMFPETMSFWGAYAQANYGWDREGDSLGHVDNLYIRYYYQGILELTLMMLDYYHYTQDQNFLKHTLLPFASEALLFYEEHYPKNSKGVMHMQPAQALETFWDVINPTPEVAGLTAVLDKLLALPEGSIKEKKRDQWNRLRQSVPPLPLGSANGKSMILPAGHLISEEIKNSENCNLYAIFPYRIFSVGKPDLEIAQYSFQKRRVKGHTGWRQDEIQAAYAGLAEEAKQGLTKRLGDYQFRFPAFWGPNFDWVPDQDHGSSGQMALQTMLLQCEGEEMYLFPAWPKEWNVNFKLHAPKNTIVEGEYYDGKVTISKVSPETRRKDLTVMSPQ